MYRSNYFPKGSLAYLFADWIAEQTPQKHGFHKAKGFEAGEPPPRRG